MTEIEEKILDYKFKDEFRDVIWEFYGQAVLREEIDHSSGVFQNEDWTDCTVTYRVNAVPRRWSTNNSQGIHSKIKKIPKFDYNLKEFEGNTPPTIEVEYDEYDISQVPVVNKTEKKYYSRVSHQKIEERLTYHLRNMGKRIKVMPIEEEALVRRR